MISSSKKGISCNQLHRALGISVKSAWFLGHRIREAMRNGDLAPFGSNGSSVESDETFLLERTRRRSKEGICSQAQNTVTYRQDFREVKEYGG